MVILFTLLLQVFLHPYVRADERRVVEIAAPLVSRTINLEGEKPAPYVLLQGWHCNDTVRYKQQTVMVADFFNWAEAHLLPPSAERREPAWVPGASLPRDRTQMRIYLGVDPVTAADAVKGAENVIKQADKGGLSFWGIEDKTTPDFIAYALPGVTKIYVRECYSKSALDKLMKLQVNAALSFMRAAGSEK